MERIELITRQHLHVQSLTPGKDMQAAIEHDVLHDAVALETWGDMALSIPARYEAYSLELLQAVCQLWTTIRCFSFAKGCNILFKKGYQRGTRQGLKKRGTEKDTN